MGNQDGNGGGNVGYQDGKVGNPSENVWNGGYEGRMWEMGWGCKESG